MQNARIEGVGTAAVSLPKFRQVTILPVPSSLGSLDDHGLHGMRMLLKATPRMTHRLWQPREEFLLSPVEALQSQLNPTSCCARLPFLSCVPILLQGLPRQSDRG